MSGLAGSWLAMGTLLGLSWAVSGRSWEAPQAVLGPLGGSDGHIAVLLEGFGQSWAVLGILHFIMTFISMTTLDRNNYK